MLTIIPQGGLCNRMRSIDAAIALSIAANTKLIVQWHKDPGLNAEFTDLFEMPDVISRLDTLDYNGRFAQLRKSTRKRLYRVLFDQYFSEKELMRYIASGGDLTGLVNKKSICIAACNRFYESKFCNIHLKPVSEILDTVSDIIPESKDIVGVHIRRSDHKVAIDRSPMMLFEKEMQQVINENDNARFFVATDSSETEDSLLRLFPDRIIVHKKSTYDRGDTMAIKDALIDLYCLSRTSKIIGSYSSSFSEEAGLIGGIEVVMMDSSLKMKDEREVVES